MPKDLEYWKRTEAVIGATGNTSWFYSRKLLLTLLKLELKWDL